MAAIVEVFSDLACPWCFIGHRRLRRAMDELPAGSVQIRPRAFELQPQLPPEGVPARAFFERKFGDAARMQSIFERVAGVGRDEGIAFDFARIHAPNTRLAHRVVALAGDAALPTMDALFRAHFEEGVDLSNLDAVDELLAARSIVIPSLADRIAAGEGTDAVLADERLARELGITSVPFFVANGRLGMSGAQSADTFKRFLTSATAAAA